MNNPPNSDVAEVLNRIRRIVWQKRIRAEEFMREHDILRKGTIPISKFRSAVDNMKMDLTARDLDLLEEYFLVPPDLVNYVAFV